MARAADGQTTLHQRYAAHVRYKRWLTVVLAVVLLALTLFSATIGSTPLAMSDLLAALFRRGSEYHQLVVWTLRMPRILTALIGGCALALAGCVFQSILRNPLASASTLGISQGAAFGASLAIIMPGMTGSGEAGKSLFLADPWITVLCAFAGAIASTLVILGLSRLREMTPEAIILAGVALSALFAGGTMMVQYFAEDTQLAAMVFWTFGDLSRSSDGKLAIMTLICVTSAVFFFYNRWNYNAMESGEASAHGLGVNLRAVRLSGMLVAAAAASSIIAFCGVINFVGLVAPHVMRRVIGADYRYLLPASALAGAILLLLSDMLAQSLIAPRLLPISSITSFVGAPMFLYLLFKGVSR